MKYLEQDIQTGELKQLYLLTGEEDYLVRQYRQKLKNALVPPDDNVNVTCYEGKNISVQELIDQAETMPFFAERRLLLVEDSGFFKSSCEQLEAYLNDLPPTAYFLFVEPEVDKRKALYKIVKNKGRVTEFARQKPDTIIRWILGILKRENKNITRHTMDLFLEKTGTDMNNIRTELDKLLAYTAGRDVIVPQDVEAICTEQTENRIFDMINAVAAGQRRQALELYYDLLSLKEPSLRILALLERQFNQLLQVKELRNHGFDAPSIAGKLGLRDFVAAKCTRQCERFSLEELRAYTERCASFEEAVKTGNLNEKLAVELLLTQRFS